MSILSRTNYLDDVDFIISDIIEYDMREAGFSVIKEEKLLTDELITSLTKDYTKDQRTIKIGKLKIKNKPLTEGMKNGIAKYKEMFGEANDIKEEEILSIKNDAVFMKKYCYNLKFGKYIEFAEKNIYQAYLKLNRLELYWGSNKILDIKGVRDENLVKHKDYLINFIWSFMRRLINSDDNEAVKYLVRFMDDYKNRRLSSGYYRELSNTPIYHMMIGNSIQPVEDIGDDYIKYIDIGYNYKNILVPLINFVL